MRRLATERRVNVHARGRRQVQDKVNVQVRGREGEGGYRTAGQYSGKSGRE